MARTPDRRQREAARERSRNAAEARQAATRRRQRIIAVVVAAVVVLSIFGAVLGSRSAARGSTATTTTSLPSTSTTRTLPDGGVTPTAAAMGGSLTGATPCPADDGSSPRVTLFAEAPPTCIDPAYFHVATIRTSVGDLTVQLNPKLAPQTVNDFVVLARYHFYDGQPVTSVRSRASFTVGLAFSGAAAEEAPGFTVPSEAPAGGQIFVPGMLAMVPATGAGDGSRGQLLVATFEDAASIDQSVTAFGTMLSGEAVLAAVNALATRSELPAEAVTVAEISVVRTSAIPA